MKETAQKILNLGCGNDKYGTHRIDFVKTEATTEVADLNGKFPYPSNYFDKVYCKSVLEHMLNLKNFVGEIKRVLKPGGKLFLRTDNAAYLPFHLFRSHEHNRIIHYEHDSNDNHYHLFVESHLRRLFREFREIHVFYSHGGKNLLNRALLGLLPGRLGKLHIDMYATK